MNDWVIVTGASSGIGKQLTLYLLEQGYNVVLTARRKEVLESITNEYSEERLRIVSWDLSQTETIKDYAKRVKSEVGQITGLVHSAGIQKTVPLGVYKTEQMMDIFKINTFSALMLVSAFSKKLYSKDNASFVLISSLAAHLSSEGKGIYASSKAALEGFVKASYNELTKKGKRLNTIVPGIVETEMVLDFFDKISEEQREALSKDYPLGFGKPEDIVYLVEFLLSDKSKWITGQNYRIDGGCL